MPGLLIDGAEVRVPGVTVLNTNDTPRLPLSREDGRKRRTKWVRMQILHTTKGIPGGRNRTPQTLKLGTGPDRGKEFDVAGYWDKSARSSAAHAIVDTDGSVGVIADLYRVNCYHAGNRGVNERSVGWEMYQLADAGLWESTIASQVACVMQTCIALGMQMQFHAPYVGPIARLRAGGGADCVGIFGHRDVTSNRGPGDPGELVYDRLREGGFEQFDFAAGEDLEVWKERQSALGVYPDGIPGPQTTRALKEAGYRHGIWALGKRGDGETEPGGPSLLCQALGCD